MTSAKIALGATALFLVMAVQSMSATNRINDRMETMNESLDATIDKLRQSRNQPETVIPYDLKETPRYENHQDGQLSNDVKTEPNFPVIATEAFNDKIDETAESLISLRQQLLPLVDTNPAYRTKVYELDRQISNINSLRFEEEK